MLNKMIESVGAKSEQHKSTIVGGMNIEEIERAWCHVNQTFSGSERSYLALVALLSILRTAWAMESRSMPYSFISSCGLPLRGT